LSTEQLPPDYYEIPEPPPPSRRRNWKRIAAWSAAGLLTLIVVSLIGILALLHNNSFRQYLLRVARAKLTETVGLDVRMRDFSVHLSGLAPAVDMYDVAIEGAAPYQQTPLLQADHVSVGIQIVSVLQRKWYLKNIVVDHPVARVFVAENGETNLPMLKSSSDQTTSVFDVGVRHVMLGHGELYYNDQKSALDADLHNFEFQSTFDPSPKRYSGGLSYSDGKIHFGNFSPVVHSFEAEFDATPDVFALKRGLLKSGSSQFGLTATLNDYVHPKITAQYQSTINTGELRQILNDTTLPVGVINITGSADLRTDANQPVLQTLALDGNVSSAGLQIHTATMHTLVRNISARFVLERGNAEIRDLRAQLLGGNLDGAFKMRDVGGAQAAELHATLRDIALGGVQTLIDPKSAQDVRLMGGANATINAAWRKTFDTAVARVDATIKGTIAPKRPADLNLANANVPVDGNIHAQYSAAGQTVSFDRSFVRTSQTSVNLNGTVSKTASLQVQVQANELREIEEIANLFGATPEPLGLGGTASFAGTVSGSTAEPRIAGQFSAGSLKVKGTEWRTVGTNLEANPSRIALRNGELVPASNRGRLTFNVNVGLDQWAFKDTSPLEIDVNATQLNVTDLKSLAGVEAPVTGTLSASVSLHGSQLNPVGQGNVTLNQATVADEPVQSASLDFQGTGNDVHGRLAIRMPAGTARSTFTYFPSRRAYDGEFQATGIRLDQFSTLKARNLILAGTLNLNAKGSGTFDDPGLQFTAQIPQLQIQNQRVNAVTLQADIADHVANIALNSQPEALNNTFIRGEGRVHLDGAYETDAKLDTSRITLQPLIAAYVPAASSDLSGETEVHATVKGPLKDSTRLDAHLTIPVLWFKYKDNLELAAAQPIQLDYSKSVLTLQKTTIRGTGTNLELQGTIPTSGDAPISMVALGTIDLSLGQMLSPDVMTSGQIQFNIDGRGQRANPDVQGQIKIVNAALAGDDLPLGLQNGNGVLTLTNNRLEIDNFDGKISGGTLKVTGGLTFRPSLQYNVAANANGIRTLFPAGVREGIDTNLTLVGSSDNATLRGQVQLTELSFSPTFDLDDIAGVAGGPAGATAPPGSFARKLNLDVNVVSTDDVNLSSTKLSLQGAANLRVRGTAAEPAVTGRVSLTEGDLIYRGHRYFIESSTLDFVDPYRIAPRVNLAVNTKVQEYDIRMLFRGTMDQLRTTYTSEPPLPPADIINLLVFGKTNTAQIANPTPPLVGAESFVASQVSGKVASGFEKIAGISSVSLDPLLGGNQQDPGARITIQQRVSANLFVTFATDATSTQRQLIKLEYQATPRVGISGVRDQNGGVAVDVRIKKKW